MGDHSEATGAATRCIERRQFLTVGAATLFVSWLPARLVLAQPRRTLEVQDLVEAAQRLHEKYLGGSGSNEASYVHELASIASRLGPVPSVELGPPFRGIMSSGMHHRGRGLVLIEWSMDAGAVYPAHNHPNYNGLTLGLEGRCRIRNFQAPNRYPPTASSETFRIRETQNDVLEPGHVASLMTTERHNIHKLHAGDAPVRGLDISTLVGEHVGFAFMDIDEASRNERGEYEAVWEKTYGGYNVD